jgi:hypothetical protein
MFNAAKTASMLLIGCLVLFVLSDLPLAQEGKVNLYFEKDTLTADIEGASLKAVLNKIKEKRGIGYQTWFGGNHTLNEKVSVHFRRLSIKEGLERILSKVNYSLVLEGSSVASVMLFGKPGKPDRTRRTRPRRRRPPSRPRRSGAD